MNREELFQAVGQINDRFVAESIRYAPEGASGSPERIVPMKKRIVTIALAAALILALGVAGFAAWSTHAARQQELKEDLQIEENHAETYVEYAVPEGDGPGLVLLSAVNDGQEQRVYLNISPVSEEEAAAFPENLRFVWTIEGTEIGGQAAPQLPTELSVSGAEAIREAVLAHAYDKETRTMTLQCFMDVKFLEKAMAELGTETLPLTVQMMVGEETRYFGPIDFAMTAEQLRYFDFGNAVYHDEELDREIEIVGLELSPFSAVWKVRYEGAEELHAPGADPAEYGPWSLLEDKVCIETKIVFSDGREFSTGGALTTPYENGTVNQLCGWGSAIDINDIQRIVLGDLVLWEK